MSRIVIIGNGVAGITAARHIRKRSDSQVTVISSESDYFFSRTALMYIYMGHMKFEHIKPYEDWFWSKNRIDLVRARVKRISISDQQLELDNGIAISYDKLILALGSQTKLFNWPGQDLTGVQGLYSLQDLALMEQNTRNTRHAVIVGGGLIGIEMAEMLHSRNIRVTFLVREKGYWQNILPREESELLGRHIKEHGVDLLLETGLERIEGDEQGRVKGVVTSKGEFLACDFVGLTTGVKPNIQLVQGTSIETRLGILVDEYLQTNENCIYAIGDCSELRSPPEGRRSIEPVWYIGRMMGETLAQTLTGDPAVYNPGVWFNSAKFFDIEYQTYGNVGNELKPNEEFFYWENEEGNKCLKLLFQSDSKRLIGINALGIRLKHEVCDRWLSGRHPVEYVIEHLYEANYDPEFSKRYETEIAQQFNDGRILDTMMES